MSDTLWYVSDTMVESADPENRMASEGEVESLRSQLQAPGRVRGAQHVAPPAPGADTVGFWHTFNAHGRTGYSVHAIGLHWLLESLGYPTQLIPHKYFDLDIEKFPKDRYDMLFRWNKLGVGKPLAVFSSWPPHEAWTMDGFGPDLVPYCAFEGDQISETAAKICKTDTFKQIWVVSEFVRSAFLKAGLSPDKVVTVPPLLFGGPWAINPGPSGWSSTRTEGMFVFGTVGTWQKRKGFLDLARAYFGTFKRSEDVVLRIHTSTMSNNDTIKLFQAQVVKDLALIAAEFGDNDFPASKKMPRIELDMGTDKTDTEICRWIADIDCYVSPAYGEGLGIPVVWAKGLGLPVIATGFGAVGDMIRAGSDTDEATLVPFRMEPVDPSILSANAMFAVETQWGVYNHADLGKSMRLAADRGRVRDLQGAAHVLKTYGVEGSKAHVKKAVKNLLDISLMPDAASFAKLVAAP